LRNELDLNGEQLRKVMCNGIASRLHLPDFIGKLKQLKADLGYDGETFAAVVDGSVAARVDNPNFVAAFQMLPPGHSYKTRRELCANFSKRRRLP
jgi:hypothetical protein